MFKPRPMKESTIARRKLERETAMQADKNRMTSNWLKAAREYNLPDLDRLSETAAVERTPTTLSIAMADGSYIVVTPNGYTRF